MSFFKTDLSAEWELINLIGSYFTHKLQSNVTRYASISDNLYLADTKKLINSIASIRLSKAIRIAAEQSDQQIMRAFADVRKRYFNQYKQLLESGLDDTNAKKQLRVDFLNSQEKNDALVRNYLMTFMYEKIPAIQGRTVDPSDAIQDYFGFQTEAGGSRAQGFIDYLIGGSDSDEGNRKFDISFTRRVDKKTGKVLPQTPESLATAFTSGMLGGAGRSQFKKRTDDISTEGVIGGGAEGDTYGEFLRSTAPSPESLVVDEDEEQDRMTDPENALLALLKSRPSFATAAENFEKTVIPALEVKRQLFDKKDNLTEEDTNNYQFFDDFIAKQLSFVRQTLGDLARDRRVNQIIENVQQMYPISGLRKEIETVPETELVDRPELQTARGLTAGGFLDKSRMHFNKMLPHIYSGLQAPLIKSPSLSLPYGMGAEQHREALIDPNATVESLKEAGVPEQVIFNRMLLNLVHDFHANSIWERAGNTLPGETKKKQSTDIFAREMSNLLKQFEGRIPAEQLAQAQAFYLNNAQGVRQRTHEDFDRVRINGELMQILSNLGFNSFGQLIQGTDANGQPVMDPRLEGELDKIVAEEAHFSGFQMDEEGEPTMMAFLPTRVGPQKKGVLHSFTPSAFKEYMRRAITNLAVNDSRYSASPKDANWSAGAMREITGPKGKPIQVEDPTVIEGINLERGTRQRGGGDSTNLSPDQDLETEQTAFGDTSDMITSSYMNETNHEEEPKKRRFKVVIK